MQIKYSCPYWGSDRYSPKDFIAKIEATGYEGAELFLLPQEKSCSEFLSAIENIRKQQSEFYFIALQLNFPVNESVDSYIQKMENNFMQLASLEPLFINSHTGKDHFSFEDNCRVIEAAMNIGVKTGVRILHETHRGRFSFHAATLLRYLKVFPEMELVGDFSHFCTVSESMLEDQQEILQQIIPHVGHIHARVGYEQGPQVNDPQAPEWQMHLQTFINWWQQIVDAKKTKGDELLTISPEFGPVPYMHVQPFTQTPLSDQWENNLFMMNKMRKVLLP